jgi:hypothetical protein
MKRAFVPGTAIIGTALFMYSINALGFAKIHEAFVRIGWGFGAILLLSGAREGVRTLAWTRTIVGPVRLSFRDAFRARLAGEALNRAICADILHFPARSSRHSGGKGGRGRALLIPDTVLHVSSGDRAIRVSRAVSSRRGGGRGARWSEGGQFSGAQAAAPIDGLPISGLA